MLAGGVEADLDRESPCGWVVCGRGQCRACLGRLSRGAWMTPVRTTVDGCCGHVVVVVGLESASSSRAHR